MKYTPYLISFSLTLSPYCGAAQTPVAPLIASEKNAVQAPEYGAPIRLQMAMDMAEAARKEGARPNVPGFTLAITDPSGSLILFVKQDGTTYVSTEFAIAKARTAAISRRATGPGLGGGPAPMSDLISLPGGFPIIVGGKTIGGIGISGTNGADIAIAQAALNVVK